MNDNREDRFGPLAFLASVIALALGLVESSLKLISLVDSSFYLTVTVFWAISLVLARKYPVGGLPRFPLKRHFVIGFATFLYLASLFATYYEHHLRKTGPAPLPRIQLSQLLGISSAHASPRAWTMTSFYLNDAMSSFEERKDNLFGAGKLVTTYAARPDIAAAFKAGSCSGVSGEKPMVAAGEVLRKWLGTTERAGLKKYIDAPKALGRLIRERGDIFAEIMPTPAELSKIKNETPQDYEILRNWILNCVGVYQPVFTITLANSSSKPVNIVEVLYDVEKVGQVLGSRPGGPIWPEETYDHTLIHSKGVQRSVLKGVFNIPPGETRAFNIRLHTTDTRSGLGWYLAVKVVDSSGNFATSPKFQLFLNPK